MKIVETENATTPAGHYAQAVVHRGVIHISGQLGRLPGMDDAEAGDIERQTSRCLDNIKAILEAAGSSMDNLLKVSVYISDIALWPDVNTVYARYLGDHKPARVVVPVPNLHYNALIEIEAMGAVP
ncbi:RidA family protein [Exilibacterium tricleocarpae]|uniref:RidA family protein n=1 Tax=Exilibacterium tricleocarpae TaxID=2591008 RepID=A0A545TNK0_9GAMM|nr:RidA family protein [Exilibacterium tricleocarpae]TQV78786.1 RidA family protein [Exilibacterium tricleocarpae]